MSAPSARWPVTLRYGRLIVRPLRYRDAAAWEEQRRVNDAWLTPWDATSPVPESGPASFGQMVRWQRRAAREGSGFTWGIALGEEHERRDQLIGLISLGGIQTGSILSGAIGYWIDQRHAGQGLTPMAVAMVCDWAFLSHGLHRVEINVRPENAASLRVPHKLGFREEGLRERYLHVAGQWCDHVSFALTAEEASDGVLAAYLERSTRGGT
ncbi:MAG: GNAT family protein [Micrococcus sp.]|nr:GNAT family protein [Micrococcus sp.]